MTANVNLTPQQAWKEALEYIELSTTRSIFAGTYAHLHFVRLDESDGEPVFIARCPNEQTRVLLNGRLNSTVAEHVAMHYGSPVAVRFILPAASSTANTNGRPEDEQAPALPLPETRLPEKEPEPPADETAAQTAKKNPTNRTARQKPSYTNNSTFSGDDDVEITVAQFVVRVKFIQVSNYAVWFWRPYLTALFKERFGKPMWGVVAYSFWETLCTYHYDVDVTGKGKPPSVAELCTVTGFDRNTILGRDEWRNNPALPGVVNTLVELGIITHNVTDPEGGKRKHNFHVAATLEFPPLLKPTQTAMLPSAMQKKHDKYLDQPTLAKKITAASWRLGVDVNGRQLWPK